MTELKLITDTQSVAEFKFEEDELLSKQTCSIRISIEFKTLTKNIIAIFEHSRADCAGRQKHSRFWPEQINLI